MTDLATYVFDPELDLELERFVDLPPALVWAAWTRPEHLVHWFCPKPWTTTDAQIDLRPGGLFRTVMRGPEGEQMTNRGCYLDIVEGERLVFTACMTEGFRPQSAPTFLPFTAMVLLAPHGESGTRYRAIVVHGAEEDRRKHEAMGFSHGWSAALDQLVSYMKALPDT
jgi:uncharacterized protein YndB with AHSA1/START domain